MSSTAATLSTASRNASTQNNWCRILQLNLRPAALGLNAQKKTARLLKLQARHTKPPTMTTPPCDPPIDSMYDCTRSIALLTIADAGSAQARGMMLVILPRKSLRTLSVNWMSKCLEVFGNEAVDMTTGKIRAVSILDLENAKCEEKVSAGGSKTDKVLKWAVSFAKNVDTYSKVLDIYISKAPEAADLV